MQTRFKRLALILLPVIILIGGYFIFKKYFPYSPYPSLTEQRTALKNKPFVTPTRILDSIQIVDDLKFLSSDSCEGIGPGTNGHELAMERIATRMREAGLDSFKSSLLQGFPGKLINHSETGENVIGWIKGTDHPEKYIVISAHYDHLGIRKGKIYHGASDNASGTACILAMAKFFKLHPLPYSLIFAAFDREESGMQGSRYFVQHFSKIPNTENLKFNLNLDMIARNDSNEIFACGISHYPSFKYVITESQKKTNAKLLMGHDTKNNNDPRYDWTNLSDHFPFYQQAIPFIYIGVEDHPDEHKPTDTWDKINLNRYIENCNLAAIMLQIIKL